MGRLFAVEIVYRGIFQKNLAKNISRGIALAAHANGKRAISFGRYGDSPERNGIPAKNFAVIGTDPETLEEGMAKYEPKEVDISIVVDDTLLKGLLERIDERLPPERAQLVGAFVKVYLRRLPDEQFAQTPLEDVYAHVLSMFGFVDSRGTEPVAVRVFTPDRERDGYATVGSVVEVSTDDAPFLVDSVVEEIQSHGLGVHRLILMPPARLDADGLERHVETLGRELVGRV